MLRQTPFPGTLVAALGLCVGITPIEAARALDPDALRAFANLTAAEWNDVHRGLPRAKILDSSEKRDVAVVGVARVRAGTTCFLTKFQDIENFKKSPDVLRIGKVSLPVDPHSLDGFRLEQQEIADLRDCSAGQCSIKLSAETIALLRSDVIWSRPDYIAQAQSLIREEILAYIETYLLEGNRALIEYRDKHEPVSLRRGFLDLLDAKPGVADFAPELRDHLAVYPTGRLSGINEFLYWSIESFGLRLVASITHVVIYAQPGRAAIATKQIYASHYFDASLGLTAVWDDTSDSTHPAMYLVYLNRSRIDLLSGFFGGLRRAILRGRLEDEMRKNLADVVRKVEAACAH